MRPRSLDEYFGHEDVIGPGTPLRGAIEADDLHSFILYGPAGSGKTSLAAVVAAVTDAAFERLSAVSAGVRDVRAVIDRAAAAKAAGMRTILFLDEIHRFNKGQQDALLPAVEDGVITMIGATTENPYFEVNSPLISRARIYVLNPLTVSDIKKILERALVDKAGGLGGQKIKCDPEAIDVIADLAGGDARRALNALETSARLAASGSKRITEKLATEAAGARVIGYDKTGDVHYDVASAFIKSMRGSDPDAALYWLALMIEAGEDPKFIARRMVIFASEDIGNADPQALLVATAAAQAVQFVGLPECRLNLAQAAIYLSVAAKSNAVIEAIDGAAADVKTQAAGRVPPHLRDSHYPGAKKLGHGSDYKYPHGFPGKWVDQQYLPDNLVGKRYYQPSNSGLEKKIAEHLEKLRSMKKPRA
ncbi:MAG: replication-associated recombination protein A [Actinomycetota bacterium]|nr:replication-associated recombination protein A [Actinomycetota bacterium]